MKATDQKLTKSHCQSGASTYESDLLTLGNPKSPHFLVGADGLWLPGGDGEGLRRPGAHKLKRAVFFDERGEIRDRSFESQAFRASGLNLVVSAVVHCNTVYIERAVAHLRSVRRDIPDHVLKHVSPLSWEHVNLTGIYSWDAEHQMHEGFRPLRLPTAIRRAA